MTDRDDRMNQAFDLFKTPFYAWIGAGVRSFEILGDIGARVRAEEEARDGSAAAEAPAADATDAADAAGTDEAAKGRAGIADSMAERLREARQRMFDLGDSAADQSREAFLNALEAAQKAFNDALTKAQAGGDRAFASAHSLPEDVQSAADQLRPEHLRAVADGYLEAASNIYRELAARGEKAVDEGVSAARERGAAFEFPRGKDGAGEDEDQAGLFGLLPFGGATGAKLAESLEGMARDSVKPFQDAGNEFLGRLDQEKMSERVQALLHQAADVTEQLLGALRAEDAAAADAANVSADDIVDGEVIDDDSAAAAAADAKRDEAKREEKDAKAGKTAGKDVSAKDIADADVSGVATDVPAGDKAADAAETAKAGDAAAAAPKQTAKKAAPRKAAKKAAPRKAAKKAAPRKAAKRTTAKKTAAPKSDSGTPTPADVKKTVEENLADDNKNNQGENK